MSNPRPIVPTAGNVLASRYWLTDKGYAATGAPNRARSPEAVLAQVRAIHEAWGDADVDEVNAAMLWEDLDRALQSESLTAQPQPGGAT